LDFHWIICIVFYLPIDTNTLTPKETGTDPSKRDSKVVTV